MRSTWTTANIPDLSGRVAVVTGANSGIGLAAALELCRHGAHVVLGARDAERGESARRRIEESVPEGSLSLEALDLADLASVRGFAARVEQARPVLDILVNNAGVMAVPRRETADGFEMQLGTNHLGHFALTGLLLPTLLRRDDACVVTVSSLAHHMGRIRLRDLQWQRRYSRWGAYAQSKLANLLFALELARRFEAAGLGLRSIAVHPGYASTNLQAVGPRMRGRRLEEWLTAMVTAWVGQPAAAGALPTLMAATSPAVANGAYLGPAGLLGISGLPGPARTSQAARNLTTARRLFAESERLTGVEYSLPAMDTA